VLVRAPPPKKWLSGGITGKTYAEELKKRITSKIGLTDTYYGTKVNTAMNDAFSYAFNNKWEQMPETDMSIPGGAGAIVSTPTDLVKFINALFAGKFISQSSLEQIKTIRDDYGMDMFQMPFDEKKTYGHNGGIDEFTSLLLFLPADSVAAAYTSNGASFSTNDVIIGALSIYFNKPYVIPDFKTLALKTEELDKYLGIYKSTQIPLGITVTKSNTTLIAQVTGQSAFSLEAVDTNKFVFKASNITLLFDPLKSEFTILQNGQRYLFTIVK
jgi:D-alanyl-D-alanine carboxypeptidase